MIIHGAPIICSLCVFGSLLVIDYQVLLFLVHFLHSHTVPAVSVHLNSTINTKVNYFNLDSQWFSKCVRHGFMHRFFLYLLIIILYWWGLPISKRIQHTPSDTDTWIVDNQCLWDSWDYDSYFGSHWA